MNKAVAIVIGLVLVVTAGGVLIFQALTGNPDEDGQDPIVSQPMHPDLTEPDETTDGVPYLPNHTTVTGNPADLMPADITVNLDHVNQEAFEQFAIAAANAWVTVDNREPEADRDARLAPYFRGAANAYDLFPKVSQPDRHNSPAVHIQLHPVETLHVVLHDASDDQLAIAVMTVVEGSYWSALDDRTIPVRDLVTVVMVIPNSAEPTHFLNVDERYKR